MAIKAYIISNANHFSNSALFFEKQLTGQSSRLVHQHVSRMCSPH